MENNIEYKKSSVISWYLTFVCLSIPFFGWIYLFIIMFSKKQEDKKNFARGYLLYKLTILIVTLLITYFIINISIPIINDLLAYMEML